MALPPLERPFPRSATVTLVVAALLLATGTFAACAPEAPSYKRHSSRHINAVPITRSNRERPNSVTYYLASITQKEDRVIVDMDILNGHSRSFQFVTLWVTLIGADGEKAIVEHPMGPLGQHRHDHVVVSSRGVPFSVEDVAVSIQAY